MFGEFLRFALPQRNRIYGEIYTMSTYPRPTFVVKSLNRLKDLGRVTAKNLADSSEHF